MVRGAKGRSICQQTLSLQHDSGVYWFASSPPKPSIRTGGQVALTSSEKLIERRTRGVEGARPSEQRCATGHARRRCH